MNILESRNISKIYKSGSIFVNALKDISFIVNEGDMICITGKSGSGKSTLLHQLGLLDKPSAGEILFNGVDVTRLSDDKRSKLRLNYLGYVFQEYALLHELTARENVYLPGIMLGNNKVNCSSRAQALLEIVGLGSRGQHRPKELSGGEQQRVAIARALINSPHILFADEPCANLDSVSGKNIMETMVRLNKEIKLTVIFVSHDITDNKYANKWLILSDGQLSESHNFRTDV